MWLWIALSIALTAAVVGSAFGRPIDALREALARRERLDAVSRFGGR